MASTGAVTIKLLLNNEEYHVLRDLIADIDGYGFANLVGHFENGMPDSVPCRISKNDEATFKDVATAMARSLK